jgi:uncharacterized coiled-coil protein SlyX
MKWEDVGAIDWSVPESTADWVKLLNELLELRQSADTDQKSSQLADALDSYADHSSSDDLSTITKLDASARKAARALRVADVNRRIKELEAACADYRTTIKELDAATASLKKETRLLRAEKVTAAVGALTNTVLALNQLSQTLTEQDGTKLQDAIQQVIKSAQKLRTVLEAPA